MEKRHPTLSFQKRIQSLKMPVGMVKEAQQKLRWISENCRTSLFIFFRYSESASKTAPAHAYLEWFNDFFCAEKFTCKYPQSQVKK
jgi:hypothetical protein